MKRDWLYKVRTRIRNESKVQAPKGLLDDIKKEMNRRGVAPVYSTPKKSKTIPMWVYRSVSVAALLAVGLYLSDLLISPDSIGRIAITGNEDRTNVAPKPSMTVSDVIGNSSTQGTIHSVVQMVSTALTGSQDNTRENTLLACNEYTDETSYQRGGDSTEVTENPQLRSNSPEHNSGISLPLKKQNGTNQSRYNYTSANRKKEPSGFCFGTSYSGLGRTSSSAQGVLLTDANPYGDFEDGFLGTDNQGYVVGSEEMKTEARHYRPVKLGMSVSYNIDSRWSVQTGLTYSQLSSDFIYSNGNSNTTHSVKQRLHYVGIPINASYSLYRKKRINLYVTAGGEVEKLVKGEATQRIENTVSPNINSVKINEKPSVFSVNAALGGEFLFSKDISVYAEPGVSYHFNNGSNIENSYKDKPTNINLSIGIRVKLNK